MKDWLLSRDTLVGIALLGFGVFVFLEGLRYPFGGPRQMGPGFFPILLGLALIVLQVAVLISHRTSAAAPFPFRSFALVSSAILVFALLVDRAGVVPATFALIMITTYTQEKPKILSALILSSVLSVVAVALFIHTLGVPLKAFWFS